MATFKFGRYIDIHWNGYDIQGPAETVFSIPDQLYEEFDADIAPVEPTLVWLDTNEFQTLKNDVQSSTLSATIPIALATSSTGKTISISSGTSPDGYVLTADGAGGVAFEASTGGLSSLVGTSPISATVVGSSATVAINSGTNPNGYLMAADGSGGVIFTPASTSGLTSVVGVSPISSVVSGGTVSVSLNASYQTAGTYVTSVIGTSPVSASGTTAITVGIDQTALSAADASTASTLRTYVKNSSGSTITKGQAVYVTGADGTNALIGLASASSDPTSSKTLGIAANTMTNNAFGYVIENGQLSNIDTSAATAGSSIWLGATPGSLVFDSPPTEPNHAVYLGVVTKANVSTGEILVKVQNGYELNELHDVFTTGVSSSLPLVYNATSDGWIAQALSSVGIADDAIVTTKILDGAVTSAKLATDSVGAAAIAAGAVGTSELATAAVTDAKIAANAVTSGHIAAGAVGSAAIAAGAVNTSKISSSGATSGQLLQADGLGAVVFATVSSGAAVSISTFTASGTWTKPAGASAVYVFALGAGGGGGSGARQVSSGTAYRNGGGGGGGGAHRETVFAASILSATVSVTVGAGGIGGSSVTAIAATAGNIGSNGGDTLFGSYLTAGGGLGAGSVSATETNGDNLTGPGAGYQQYLAYKNSINSLTDVTATGVTPAAFTTALTARYFSGGFGTFTQASANSFGAAGGSGGGGKNSSDTYNAGSYAGLGFGMTLDSAAIGGSAGSAAAVNGSAAGATGVLGMGNGGAGGGSGASGGAGGNGWRGGGGGGGGAANRANTTSQTSGAGGTGGNGYVVVISW